MEVHTRLAMVVESVAMIRTTRPDIWAVNVLKCLAGKSAVVAFAGIFALVEVVARVGVGVVQVVVALAQTNYGQK